MAVLSISISLRAWHREGRPVRFDEFFGRLSFASTDPTIERSESVGEWQAARLVFVALQADDFKNAQEPAEAFAAALRFGLDEMARWLLRQSSDVFDKMRQTGLKVDVFIRVWIDQDQLDLDLPAELLGACGAHGLGVSIITND
jgi:hypothetical protein